MNNNSIVYVDIETRNWFDQPEIAHLPRDLQISAMGFGIGVTWDSVTEGYKFWYEADGLFDYLLQFDIVAGWNITSFDIPILAREAGSTAWGFPKVYDPFAIIKELTGRWYKLEDMCQANLGRGKTGDGLQAARWLAAGGDENTLKAVEYCRNDVELEMLLGEKIRQGIEVTLPGMRRNDQSKPLKFILHLDAGEWTLHGKL